MSTDDRYNGWTNRETWAVALHINNDQGWQESVHAALRDWWGKPPGGYVADPNEARMAGEIIRENFEVELETMSDSEDAFSRLQIQADIGSLWRVDWTELGAAFLTDLEES